MNEITNDRAIRTLRQALDGLSLRQQTISNNVANINTPGFKASRVSFEEQLQFQLQRRSPQSLERTSSMHIDPEIGQGPTVTRDDSKSMRADGNNVDIDWEMARLAETVINYNTVSELVSLKLAVLKNIINSR